MKPDIAAVLTDHGAHVPHRTGWIPVRCPYHGDNTASASVNLDVQRFRCHACGVRGDAYDLIQEWENCDFKTARTIGQQYQQANTPTTPPARRSVNLW